MILTAVACRAMASNMSRDPFSHSEASMSLGPSRRGYRDEADTTTISGCIAWMAVMASFLHRSHASMARALLNALIFIGGHAAFMMVTSFQCRDSAMTFIAGNH